MKRLQEFFESIAYAGLKPSDQKSEPHPDKAWGRLRAKFDQFLSGGPAPSDPLYLTNRSLSQKVRPWIIVGVPFLVLLGAIGLSLSNILDPPEAKPVVDIIQPTPA